MTDWSKVGKRSRRKGKTCECEVANKLAELTGRLWSSTRNSGRTDLKGDVYCVGCKDPNFLVVEVKNRDWKWSDILKRNAKVERELDGVKHLFLNGDTPSAYLLIVAKVESVLWYSMYLAGENGAKSLRSNFNQGDDVLFINGVFWSRLDALKDDRDADFIVRSAFTGRCSNVSGSGLNEKTG